MPNQSDYGSTGGPRFPGIEEMIPGTIEFVKTGYRGSVKVMRSYDYCHFEVQLASDEIKTIAEIDAMRKEAARLVDKAVKQYAEFKGFLAWKTSTKFGRGVATERAKEIKVRPESEWTSEEKATVKLASDIEFWRSREYDYQDDWDEDYPEDEF